MKQEDIYVEKWQRIKFPQKSEQLIHVKLFLNQNDMTFLTFTTNSTKNTQNKTKFKLNR